ncbi:MAG: F0F1 ATP synthase subunit delta, partial [Polaribacter sp.]
MKDGRAALRYAKAILNLAKDTNSETVVNNDMLLIATTIEENSEFEVMLNSPIINIFDKIE